MNQEDDELLVLLQKALKDFSLEDEKDPKSLEIISNNDIFKDWIHNEKDFNEGDAPAKNINIQSINAKNINERSSRGPFAEEVSDVHSSFAEEILHSKEEPLDSLIMELDKALKESGFSKESWAAELDTILKQSDTAVTAHQHDDCQHDDALSNQHPGTHPEQWPDQWNFDEGSTHSGASEIESSLNQSGESFESLSAELMSALNHSGFSSESLSAGLASRLSSESLSADSGSSLNQSDISDKESMGLGLKANPPQSNGKSLGRELASRLNNSGFLNKSLGRDISAHFKELLHEKDRNVLTHSNVQIVNDAFLSSGFAGEFSGGFSGERKIFDESFALTNSGGGSRDVSENNSGDSEGVDSGALKDTKESINESVKEALKNICKILAKSEKSTKEIFIIEPKTVIVL